jgi:acetyl esterase/lipase
MADDVRANTLAGTQLGDVVRLWPSGAPRSSPSGVGREIAFRSPAAGGPETTMLRNVSDPTLTVFRPEPGRANGTGVIVAPGGGWRVLAWEHEGVDLARWLAGRGYTALLLKYRLAPTPADPAEFAAAMARLTAPLEGRRPAAKAPSAIENVLGDEATRAARVLSADDGRRALKIARERAAEWGLHPERIGMAGFSAGAFVTIDVALEPDGPAPAFVAPIYGGGASGRKIPADAPPLFTCVAEDDRMLFRIVEGLYRDWSDADRPAELHVFARGGHGFGMVRRGLPVDRWVDLFGDWLADQALV